MDFKKILFKTTAIDVEHALPDAVIFCEKNGKIQWVNDKASEIFETSKMHLMTSYAFDFIENVLNLAKNAAQQGCSVIAKKIGAEKYYEMTVNELDNGFVLDLREIADKDKFNRESNRQNFNEANYDENLFLYKLSNDFKSPLQSIVGFAQAMADGLGGSMTEQQEKYIKIIKKNSSDLMYFTDKLLELSATEADVYKLDFKTFDILNLANLTVKYNEQLYKDKDISLSVELAENTKNVVATDSDILRNILQNILEVILKTVDTGEIKINISTPDEEILSSRHLAYGSDYLMITISSSAMLLSEKDLEEMFNPYKIVDTANRKNLLRAIILAATQNLISKLSGILWVESQILKNTNFNVIIPVISKE